LNTEQAIWQTIIIAAIVLGGMVLIVIAYFERHTHGEWRRRKLLRGTHGQITQIGGIDIPEPVRVKGSGTYTAYISLERGRYKFGYRLADNVLTAVKLIEAQTGDEIIMFAKTGVGEIEITIETDRRYVIEIDPTDGSAPSELLISPLGLPSQRAASE
jgi:hypothetical protein